MTDDTRPIAFCPRCKCDVVTLPSGHCAWCLRKLVTVYVPPPVVEEGRRLGRPRMRRADGVCAACGLVKAQRGRTRCANCVRYGIPCTRAHAASDGAIAS